MRLLRYLALALVLPLIAVAQEGTNTVSGAPIAGDAATAEFAWEDFGKLAARADAVIERGEASTSALEELRRQLSAYRTQAAKRRDEASAQMAPVQERLKALGPAPAEGESEPADVAALRAELNDRLSKMRAPMLAAEDVYTQADGLIRRIDEQIRARTTRELMELDPSPLNPARWVEAGQAVAAYARAVSTEVSDNFTNPARRAARAQALPVALALIGIAIVLLFRSRRWSRALQDWLSARSSLRWAAVFGFVGALSQLLLPLVGLTLLVSALSMLAIFGVRGSFLLNALFAGGVALYFATWVTRVLFVPTPQFPALIEVTDQQRRKLRLTFVVLGLVFALRSALVGMEQANALIDGLREVIPVLQLPLVVLGGLSLWRIGRMVRGFASSGSEEDSANPFLSRVATLLGTFCMGVGALGPVLAVIGYTRASGFLVFATALSLLTIAGFYILFRLIGTITGSLGPVVTPAGADEAEQKRYGALFHVALGFLFICAAVPLLALIWGVRVSELQEAWTWLSEGFSIGDTRVSLTDFLTFVLIFTIGYTLTRLIQTALRTTVMPNTRLDSGGQNAIVTGTGYLGIFLSALAAIGATGLDLSNLALVASALTVGIGFGLQTIVSNFVSGIILLIERPIKLGDWIEVGGTSGYVSKISVRSTVVETFDRASVVIPNADLIAGTVTNWTHSSMAGRVIVPVGVAYDSDPRHVERVLREIAEAHPMVLMNPPPAVVFMGFGADSMDFEIRAILRDVNWMLSSRSDMNFEIAKRFREEGIEIPFAQRDVFIKNLGDLKPGEPMPDSRKDGAEDDDRPVSG